MPTFPSFQPRFGGGKGTQPRVDVISFGEGYEQRIGQGLNTISDEFSFTFTLSIANADTLEAFLVARAGSESFDFTPPRTSTAIKVIAPSWSRNYAGPNVDSIGVTFRQVHDL